MKQITLSRTTAAGVSDIFPAFEQMTADLQAVATEHNISQTLLLCMLRDYCDRRLSCPVD